MSITEASTGTEPSSTEPSSTRPRGAARATEAPAIITDLYDAVTKRGMSLVDVTWEQQRLHESRRWSVVEMLADVDLDALTPVDRNLVWNAGRAELTTKPGADRLERQAEAECRRWQEKNPAVASIMEACGTWSRYWNEEEAHHETVFNRLADLSGMEPISDETFIAFRQVFPDDDMLRTLMLLAISEITAAVNYGQCQQVVQDPGLRRIFKQVAADEIQHRNYFIAFAKALVDSGEYHAKDAFAVAHLFLREDGELQGSAREQKEDRGTHVNWWDHLDTAETDYRPEALEKKEQLICGALKKITGIEVHSRDEVEDTWLDLIGS
ncbi:ferritin-like domain-containing protein [Kitasatospora sp. NBC_01266]|uniref:ferritin-like domain-containing protein n=1 Tax=Kitasatospora sp. NBC_01266 TaxID=2903572 RepID=UPI002E2FC40B|nr:ferritin-like domain-containing protein [Kitasatospora sp. NBC_01266]